MPMLANASYAEVFTNGTPYSMSIVPPSQSLLVADSMPCLIEFYAQLLTKDQTADYQLIYARTGKEALAQFANRQPDLVILDIKLTDFDAFETAKQIWNAREETKIVFLVDAHRESYLRQIMTILPEQAVFGYVLKSQSDSQIAYAIQCVFLHDNSYIDPSARATLKQMRNRSCTLTDAELATLIDMTLGLTDRQIAARHNVSVRGIQNRINMVFQKLLDGDSIRNYESEGGMINLRVRAIFEAIRRGLLDMEYLEKQNAELLQYLKGRATPVAST